MSNLIVHNGNEFNTCNLGHDGEGFGVLPGFEDKFAMSEVTVNYGDQCGELEGTDLGA